jgi:hypothetical protein
MYGLELQVNSINHISRNENTMKVYIDPIFAT